MIAEILAQLTETAQTPVGILMATQALGTTALGIVYRDCRKDRETLWKEILDLKNKKG